MAAQTLLLVLFVFALARTFWPRRSITLPTMTPSAATSVAADAEVAERVAELERKVEAMEAALTVSPGEPRRR